MNGIQPGGNTNNERDSTRGKCKLNGIQPGGNTNNEWDLTRGKYKQ